MGLLAELLVRTYYESQNKTTYAISNLNEQGDEIAPSMSDAEQTLSHSK
jgi:hypothetical protein